MAMKKRRTTRVKQRELSTLPVYGRPTQLRPYRIGDLTEGKSAPLRRHVSYVGEVMPRTTTVSGKTYFFFKRVARRATAKKVVDSLRRQGYRARVFDIARHPFGRTWVVDHAIYTKPRHPKANDEGR